MKIKLILASLLLCAMGSFAVSAQSGETAIRTVLADVEAAFAERNTGKIVPHLAENFSLSTSNMPGSMRFLDPIVQIEGGVTAVKLLSVEAAQQGLTHASVVFEGALNKNNAPSVVAFDAENRIVFVDMWDRLYGGSRFGESRLVAEVPFEFRHGHILIKLRLNDHPRILTFLFDSGADGMAISSAMADSVGLTAGHSQRAQVVGGAEDVRISRGNTVHLGDEFRLQGQNLALFGQMGDQTDGIIGLNMMTGHIAKFDMDREVLSLYTFGEHDFGSGGATLDVEVPHGVILVPVGIDLTGSGEVRGEFVFDTGANYHIICFNPFVRRHKLLVSGFKPESQGTTVSFGVVTPNFSGRAHEVVLAPDIRFRDLPITLQASSGSAPAMPHVPDGSLGVHTITKFNFTVDLLRKKVHLEERAN